MAIRKQGFGGCSGKGSAAWAWGGARVLAQEHSAFPGFSTEQGQLWDLAFGKQPS